MEKYFHDVWVSWKQLVRVLLIISTLGLFALLEARAQAAAGQMVPFEMAQRVMYFTSSEFSVLADGVVVVCTAYRKSTINPAATQPCSGVQGSTWISLEDMYVNGHVIAGVMFGPEVTQLNTVRRPATLTVFFRKAGVAR